MIGIFYKNTSDIDVSIVNKPKIKLLDYFEPKSIIPSDLDAVIVVESGQKLKSLDDADITGELVTIQSKGWHSRKKQIYTKQKFNNHISNINIESNAQHPFITNQICIDLYRNKLWQDFLKESNKTLVGLSPNNSDFLLHFYYNFLVCYHKIKDYKQAAVYFDRSLNFEPNFHEIICAAADASCEMGDYTKAKDLYEKSIYLTLI